MLSGPQTKNRNPQVSILVPSILYVGSDKNKATTLGEFVLDTCNDPARYGRDAVRCIASVVSVTEDR